jgi:two-component system invasion response regulator UvrY
MKMSAVTQPRTILLAAENLMRSLLARTITASGRFVLIADFGEAEGARAACLSERPDFVIIEVEQTAQIRLVNDLRQAGLRVLVLSAMTAAGQLQQLLEAGIDGFVPRHESIESLEEAMEEVAAGRRYHPAWFLHCSHVDAADPAHSSQVLNPTEQTILREVAAGRTSRSIAQVLRLSPRSVETYRSRIMRKLGVPNAAALAEYAVKSGLVS